MPHWPLLARPCISDREGVKGIAGAAHRLDSMRLLLIRHGQTPANVAGLLDTAHPGPGLTALGVAQAAEIPDALRQEPVSAIYASTLVRTQLTAAPLAEDRGLDVGILPGIHEIEACDLEGAGDRASIRAYLETAFSWGLGRLETVMPGGADGRAFFARFDADIERMWQNQSAPGAPSGAVVVVSHGAAIRVWVAGRATNVPPMFAGEHEIQNTGVVELEGSPELGWTLLSWQGTPVGGPELVDDSAEDPTGETLDEARA
jgi:broad specificity phosphatase PhoE